MKWFLKVMRQYADFNGRARRKEYWMFVFFFIITLTVAMVVDNTLGIASPTTNYGPIYVIALLAMFLPSLAVGVRRMHDVGKSGWYLLIPIYSFILAVTDSQPGSNEYGPNPKEGGTIADHLTETTV